MTVESTAALPENGTKTCRTCGKTKLITEFHFQREAPRNGQKPSEAPRKLYRPDCKECHCDYMRQRRRSHVAEGGIEYVDKEANRIRKFYADNPDRLDMRKANGRARYAALSELRARHPNEFEQLFLYYRKREGIPNDYPH